MIPFLKSEFVSLVSFNNVDGGFSVEFTFNIGPRGRVFQSQVMGEVVRLLEKLLDQTVCVSFDHMPIEYTFDAINSKGSAVFQAPSITYDDFRLTSLGDQRDSVLSRLRELEK